MLAVKANLIVDREQAAVDYLGTKREGETPYIESLSCTRHHAQQLSVSRLILKTTLHISTLARSRFHHTYEGPKWWLK